MLGVTDSSLSLPATLFLFIQSISPIFFAGFLLRRPSRNIDSSNGYLTGGDLGGLPSPNAYKFEYADCADV